ncbi:hypothetical protein [Cerasicoccus fimbriatus]|uniref:hypothetical protein n=1 Tax=Cerasicoccus fimbriatus TaxID=3014554 RepID=UPI0022B568B7|nr:hypothetical protein [Cerasicoccus sp. TK19100]
MIKFKYLLPILLIVFCAGCGKKADHPLVGNWAWIEHDGEKVSEKYILQISSNGRWKMKNLTRDLVESEGRYEISGNVIAMELEQVPEDSHFRWVKEYFEIDGGSLTLWKHEEHPTYDETKSKYIRILD